MLLALPLLDGCAISEEPADFQPQQAHARTPHHLNPYLLDDNHYYLPPSERIAPPVARRHQPRSRQPVAAAAYPATRPRMRAAASVRRSDPPASSLDLSGQTIIVDPGHGGKDPGAMGRGTSRYPEKVLALNIGEEVRRLLIARGARVISSRRSDKFIPLNERAALADRYRASLLVSIHIDAAQSSRASGATFYIARQPSRISRQTAEAINAAFHTAGLEARGVRRANFRVLVGHQRPSVLVECGYISNAGDARRLNRPSHQSKVAAAIVAGIAKVLR